MYKRFQIQIILALLIICAVFIGFFIYKLDISSRRVDRDSLLIVTVERGDLDVVVSANGQLRSLEIALISSEVEGRVANVFVSIGDEVVVGQTLFQLSNPKLVVAAEEQESALESGNAEFQATKVNLENRLLDQEVAALRAKFAYEKEVLKLEAEEQLHQKKVVSEIDFRQRQLSVTQLRQTSAIEAKRLKQSQDNMGASLAVKKSNVKQLERLLKKIKTELRNLSVVAGITGTVQSLDLEIGQQLALGFVVGEIAVRNLLYAQLKVSAQQTSELQLGQKVIIDTRIGRVDGIVSRIDPRVTDGSVVVDVKLISNLPAGARPQLRVEGLIYIDQLVDVVHVGKPAFVRENHVVSLYKLDDAEEYARRVRVSLGRSTIDRVEIKGGLLVGDKVILSGNSDWSNENKILLD